MRKFLGFLLTIIPMFVLVAKPAYAATPTDLLSEDLYTWYDSQIGNAPSNVYSGAWVMEPLGDNLYFGLSRSVPTHDDNNAYFGYFDGTNLNAVSNLSSEDINRMTTNNGKVFIPGLDPVSSWEGGQIHIYDPDLDNFTTKTYRYPSQHYVDATTTDANGIATFTGLKPTTYQIEVIKPGDYVMTSQSATSYIDDDSAPRVETMCSAEDTPAPLMLGASTQDNIDFGFVSSPGASADAVNNGTRDDSFYTGELTLEHYVWDDANGDGYQDPGESGIPGVRVELYSRDPYFPCGVHMGGIYADSDTDYLYANIGYFVAYPEDPKYYVQTNYTVRSIDNGNDWEIISIDEPTLDHLYWATSFTKFNGNFYKLHTQSDSLMYEGGEPYLVNNTYIEYSPDAENWSVHKLAYGTGTLYVDGFYGVYDMYSRPTETYDEFVEFRDKLVFLHNDGDKVVYLSGGANEETIDISGATFGDMITAFEDPDNLGVATDVMMGSGQRYNSTATDGEYLYAIGADNKVYASANLHNWSEISDFGTVDSGAQVIALEYWPNQNTLVAATGGNTGSLYEIAQSDIRDENFSQILNGDSSLHFYDGYENEVDLKQTGGTLTQNTIIKDGSLYLGEIGTTFSGTTMDWNSAVGGSDQTSGKAFLSNLTSAIGTEDTETLYVPFQTGKDSERVRICPDADSFDDVADNCSNGFWLTNGEVASYGGNNVVASVIELEGISYWKITGLTSGGGGSEAVEEESIITHIINSIGGTITSLLDNETSEEDMSTAEEKDTSDDILDLEYNNASDDSKGEDSSPGFNYLTLCCCCILLVVLLLLFFFLIWRKRDEEEEKEEQKRKNIQRLK